MRLLVDAQAVQSASALRGIGRYSSCLLQALVETSGDHQVEVLLNGGGDPHRLLRAREALETVLPRQAVHVLDAAWPWMSPHGERLRAAAEASYGAAVRSLAPDALLVLSTFEDDADTVLAVAREPDDPPTAAVLYDLMPALDPRTYLLGRPGVAYRRRLEDLGRCTALLAISEHSGRQADTVFGPDCPPITTVWGGPFPTSATPDRDDLDLPQRFLLTVGGDHPRKNLDRLVCAWGMVPQWRRAGVTLVVACGLHDGTVRRLTKLRARSGLAPSDLVLLGRVSDESLAGLYARAEAFVFASLEEGLGMPPLEAMAAGCPTLLARGSSLSELSDDASSYFDALNPVDMAGAMTAVLSDPDLRDRLRSAAARTTTTFTWERTARLAWSRLATLVRPPVPQRSPETAGVVVRLSDQEAVSRLPTSPTSVLLDTPIPSGPVGVLGLPVSARAAVAAATALLVSSVGDAARAVRSGLLDLPLVAPGTGPRHDFLAEYRRGLARLRLDQELAAEIVRAARQPPRWMLERPLPVWLVLTQDVHEMAVHDDDPSVHLVVALESAVGLAVLVDTVLVQADRVEELSEPLLRARGRGACILALHENGPERHTRTATPTWCRDVAVGTPLSVLTVREALAPTGNAALRSTGWPWRHDA